MKKLVCISFIIHVIVSSLTAQKIAGDWYGLRNYPDIQTRMILHISEEEGKISCNYDSPDVDAYSLQLDSVSLIKGMLYLRYEAPNVTFRGAYDEEAQTIVGTYFYDEGYFPLSFSRHPIDYPDRSFAYIKDHYTKEEVYITMRDGVRLFTSIYAPKNASQSYPILIQRTPYNIEPNEENYNGRLFSLYHLAKEGYIMVFQDVRGRFMSEGKFEDVRPFNPNKKGKQIDENSDTYDTIDWLIKNVKNNNGRAGIFGISYPGFYSTMALPDAHPALKAASPQAPVGNWFIGDDWHHNGAFFLLDASSFYSSIGVPRPKPTRSWPNSVDISSEDNYDFYMDVGPVKNISKNYFGDTIQFWSDLMTHPNYDDFWKARNPMPHLKEIKPAVLVVGGWFDAEDLYGPLETYRRLEKQNPGTLDNRLIMGPWSHGQWSSWQAENLGNMHWGSNTSLYFKEVELQFFNYYLKDKGSMDLPEANIFITGSNKWKGFDQWPPNNSRLENFYLGEGETISSAVPTTSNSYDEYLVDPDKPVPYTEDVHFRRTREYLTDDQRFASRRPDVMVYQTDLLTQDMTIVGPVQVNFYVATTGTDADYVVKLIDVFPDKVEEYPENDKDVPIGGYQMLVRGEVLRGRFRNSFEKPEAFVPGEVTKVSFEIPDLAHTFKKGHRFMIQVQNSWFPLVDRNPQQYVNIYEADEKDFIKATHRIYHDKDRPSHISVMLWKED